ncbi:DNA-binding transcriptional ArsR family regulator [Pelomonas saccharophila]|uniref:DNA-binding transcriptional ArsR family regulator n=1 Tax=Roseateles saccharophilus TaxID=304 RepID=A0ABU1YIM0_ROSSA|nr:metalloregulator ArsR/SmtB family transcription factor [Roseateles saccharophilus]MDR7268696.1 DNA-binding transcriptional ArsR family regulator [Roseateles saccharophilus]
MVNETDAQLDLVFAALSDATRRRVLEQLDGGGATVSELAEPHGMSLPGFMKHLAVLEAAGLIARAKEGRVVRCELDAAPLQAAAAWVSRYERFWGEQLGALGRYLYQKEQTPSCTTNSKRPPRSASNATTPSAPKKSGGRGPSRKP